jgi:hypothetical protein
MPYGGGDIPRLHFQEEWMAKIARPIAERFWALSIPEPNSGCWLWMGSVNSCGYGHFGLGSRTDKTRRIVTASRFAFELTYGPVPDGLQVLHHCDVPCCVNPEHLYAGTRSQNMQDAYDRGRQPPRHGSHSPFAKLTDEIVREIRKSNKFGTEWARELGCTHSAIYSARNGKSWRHING